MQPKDADRPDPDWDRLRTIEDTSGFIEREEARQARASRRKTEAQARLLEARARQVEVETEDLALTTFHRSALFVVAMALSLVILVHTVLDPSLLTTLGGATVVALLAWLRPGR